MTQKDVVTAALQQKAMSIKDVAEETGILEPNVRRILGIGAKEGTFERVDRGVYTLVKDGQDVAVIHTADAVESLPRLAQEGLKADMVFLDIPYTTPAVKGGNRPQKFKVITPGQFGTVIAAIYSILRTDDSPVYYIASKAPSGLKEMTKYTDQIYKSGFKLVAEGEYIKLQNDGVSVSLNPQGKPTAPESVQLFTKSGNFTEKEQPRELNFRLVRPPVAGKNGRQAKKSPVMLNSLIKQGTLPGETVVDPFAGTGVCPIEAVRLGRKAVAIEIEHEVVDTFIVPQLREAASVFALA